MGKSKEESGSVAEVKGWLCDHPTMPQPRPKPCQTTDLCYCGKIQSCPVCHQPDRGPLCECMQKRMDEIISEVFPELGK